MRPCWLLIVGCLLWPARGQAAFDLLLAGARPAGLAGAFVAVADDANAPFLNPAGMSQLRRPEGTVYYTVLYGVDGLSQTMASGAIPTRVGAFGLYIHMFGGSLYRETTMGISVSRKIGNRVLLGGSARALSLSIARYGSARAWGIDTGLLIRLPGDMRIGFVAHDITRTRPGAQRDGQPGVICAGVSRVSERLTFSLQIDRDPRHGLTTRIGQEYRPIAALSVRSGMVAQPSMLFFGLGIALSRIDVSYALASHPLLGSTHRVSLSVRLGRKNPG